MDRLIGQSRMHPGWWTVVLLATLTAVALFCTAFFNGWFRSYVPVTLTSERAGLVLETGAKVKLRGVQVGRVASVAHGQEGVRLVLQLDPDQIKHIPANIEAQISATTAFGAKFVDLIYPEQPSPRRLAADAVLQSGNVSTEVNTVFQNLVDLLHQIDPAKLNATLTALADGMRGQGETIGQTITDTNAVLVALNSRSDTMRQDWHSIQGFSDTYSAAAQDILTTVSAVTTTSATINDHAKQLDTLLLNTIGLSRDGINLLAPNMDNLIKSVNVLEPTTSLLMKYNPEYTCVLMGAKWYLDNGGYQAIGGNGYSVVQDATLNLGDDPYRYPDNLPIVAAKGGPGGKPGCGSLPDATKNYPVRSLVVNTGFGTGLDYRPNPGIAHPLWVDFLPVTRAVPEPPSFRLEGPPAIGPVPYPGAPPYGAPLYGPDATPLYPGVPPAPAPPAAPPGPADVEGAQP
jgi:phospholipid/cholesterol/gamma-HCH transport system substrate-binding protein